VIGSVLYTAVNYFILAAILGVPISPGKSLFISAVFTAVSFGRTYTIRRAFNGRSPWQALRATLNI
jgi:hypothetical protein